MLFVVAIVASAVVRVLAGQVCNSRYHDEHSIPRSLLPLVHVVQCIKHVHAERMLARCSRLCFLSSSICCTACLGDIHEFSVCWVGTSSLACFLVGSLTHATPWPAARHHGLLKGQHGTLVVWCNDICLPIEAA